MTTSTDIVVTQDSEVEDSRLVDVSTSSLVLNSESMDRIYAMGSLMANGRATIPKHLQGNAADCTAVAMQAMQWGMNPFAVAQKTHVTQGGALGYEAQLVNAVVIAKMHQRPDYEFLGNWDKILGKVKEMKSDKGGKYYVSDWNKADEDGLGVICSMILPGESAPRSIRVMMSQAYPRFSTQWATDPMQQICFLAVRKFARRHAPDVILGVYTPDELYEITAPARDMGSAEVVAPPAELLAQAQAAADQGVAAYQQFFQQTSKENRKALAGDHERLKKAAIDFDASRTFETAAPTATAAQAEVDPAFIAAMDGGKPADEYVPE